MDASALSSQARRCLLGAALLLSLSTSATCNTTAVDSGGLYGAVTDELAQPIAGATVTVAPLNLTLTTQADGSFFSKLPTQLPTYATLTYSAPGYSSATRSILGVSSYVQLLPVELHKAYVQTISLPAAGEPAATLSNTVADGGVTLTIAAGMLADRNGQSVSGDANVELTYWHPQGEQTSMPALLMAAQNGNQPVPLQSFGMVNLAATQNG